MKIIVVTEPKQENKIKDEHLHDLTGYREERDDNDEQR